VEANWTNVRTGMSGEQVIAILGEPTSADRSGYTYQGEAGDSGVVRGSVSIRNGRVDLASPPTF
jgi:hypothetical protein